MVGNVNWRPGTCGMLMSSKIAKKYSRYIYFINMYCHIQSEKKSGRTTIGYFEGKFAMSFV